MSTTPDYKKRMRAVLRIAAEKFGYSLDRIPDGAEFLDELHASFPNQYVNRELADEVLKQHSVQDIDAAVGLISLTALDDLLSVTELSREVGPPLNLLILAYTEGAVTDKMEGFGRVSHLPGVRLMTLAFQVLTGVESLQSGDLRGLLEVFKPLVDNPREKTRRFP